MGPEWGPSFAPEWDFWDRGGSWEDDVFCGDMRGYRKN
jgi:hypothetical protein